MTEKNVINDKESFYGSQRYEILFWEILPLWFSFKKVQYDIRKFQLKKSTIKIPDMKGVEGASRFTILSSSDFDFFSFSRFFV